MKSTNALKIKKSIEVRAVFLDISKAFDKVWHEGLLFKLKKNGISGPLFGFLRSYLQNRSQRVVIDGFHSEYMQVESGVPQGSVLGPLLFLIYINDLQNNISSNVKYFADDTMMYQIVESPIISSRELNDDLEKIRQWAHKWKLEFNPDPTKQATEMIFSCKRNKPVHPPLFFSQNLVTREASQKHLGIVLQPSLSFKKHLYGKLVKAMKIVYSMKSLSRYLPTTTLDTIYKSFIRPHLDYCDVIYHVPARNNMGQVLTSTMEEVERLQYKSALVVTGTWKGTNRTKLYEELGWESLSDRRRSRRILLLHRIVNRNAPSYLIDALNVRDINPNEAPPRLRCPARYDATDRYKHSFFPDAIANWNNIMQHFTKMPSLTNLKTHLNVLFRPMKKCIFGIHDPLGIRYIFQLRVGLSPLNSHKKRHGFVDTPSDCCSCGRDTEDTNHYVFNCPLHTLYRASLAATVVGKLSLKNLNHLSNSIDVYLYGHSNLTDEENKIILKATIKFIKDTKRFT